MCPFAECRQTFCEYNELSSSGWVPADVVATGVSPGNAELGPTVDPDGRGVSNRKAGGSGVPDCAGYGKSDKNGLYARRHGLNDVNAIASLIAM